jgi:tRNA-specific 2-thiouridylase
MSRAKRVFVAMSGGVDSSVTAYLLKEKGYSVQGVHLELSPEDDPFSQADHADLERTCDIIGIPLDYLDARNDFEDTVITYFCEEYLRGRTPNPCIRCNHHIKFGLLLDKVLKMGGDFLASGHYARVRSDGSQYLLLKGIDASKDQSYFLYILGQSELAHVLFPLGDLHKSEVKKLAASLGLPAVKRKESQDICFLPEGDYRAFLNRHITAEPGEIVDTAGKVMGRHKGLVYHTVGQRQGIGVSAKERLYVVKLEAGTNRLVIGPEDNLLKSGLKASKLNWISGTAPYEVSELTCKVRYRALEVKVALAVRNGIAEVHFAEPQKAIAPGQSIVFYQDYVVLGGGLIDETEQ